MQNESFWQVILSTFVIIFVLAVSATIAVLGVLTLFSWLRLWIGF